MLCCQPNNPADRKFIRRGQIITSVCLIAYLVCAQIIRDKPVTPTRIVFAALAGAFFFALLVNSGTLVLRRFDEFQRILLTRSFVWATVITMGFATVWGMAELFSHDTIPQVSLVWLPIILVCITAAAKVFIFRQHKSPAE